MKISRFRAQRRTRATPPPKLRRQREGAPTVDEGALASLSAAPDARVDSDAALAERARTLWQYGDWTGLAELAAQPLDTHPLRARLALMMASALFQLGRADEAARLVAQAESWGCPRDVLLRAYVAGALNSLGRVHALRGRDAHAARRFQEALAIAFPGGDHPLTLDLRRREQYLQLGLEAEAGGPAVPPTAARVAAAAPSPSASGLPDYALLDALLDSGDLAAWSPGDDALAGRITSAAAAAAARAGGSAEVADYVLSVADTGRLALRLLHVRGDYIPGKMVRERSFYEADFLRLLQQFHEPLTLVVDVGANIGNHTLFFASVLNAAVAAIEPEPHNAVCLECNLALNAVRDRVRVHRVAVGREPGRVQLQMAIANNFGSFSSTPQLNPNSQATNGAGCSVAVIPLDALLQQHHAGATVGIVKIDVEGMELEVLRGAVETLRRDRPLVAVECFNRQEFDRVDAFLAGLGYVPVALRNATPTFVYVAEDQPFHAQRLREHLRVESVSAAARRPGFSSAAR